MFYFSSFIFKKITFIEKINHSEKNVIVEEELDCIDIDDIGNSKHLPRLSFIGVECGNIIVVDDVGELTRNSNQNKKSNVLQ